MKGGSLSDSLKGTLFSLQVCLFVSLKCQSGVEVWGREENHMPGKCRVLVSQGCHNKLPHRVGDSK